MRLLITGASGQLGAYLLQAVREQGVEVVAWSGTRAGHLQGVPLHPIDLTDSPRVSDAFHHAQPTVVIHTAALASVAACYREPRRAEAVNVRATADLAELAQQAGVRLILTSTDLVFDGEGSWYRETDAPAPLSIYGRSKRAAEEVVLAIPGGVAARLCLLGGPTLIGRPAFYDEQAAALRERRPVTLFTDEWRTPLSLTSAARALLALARSDFTGLIHVGGPERLSRLEMGQRLAASLGLDPSPLVAAGRASFPAPEPRPRDVSLDCSLWRQRFPDQPLV